MKYTPPKRDDESKAKCWRGPLFDDYYSPIMWKDGSYKRLAPPHSVTFPICGFCGHVVWEWPHFEEPVPDNAVCEACFKEDEDAAERDQWR
jgi:hypothetical protein